MPPPLHIPDLGRRLAFLWLNLATFIPDDAVLGAKVSVEGGREDADAGDDDEEGGGGSEKGRRMDKVRLYRHGLAQQAGCRPCLLGSRKTIYIRWVWDNTA